MKKLKSLMMVLVITVFVLFTCQKEQPFLASKTENVELLNPENIKQERSVKNINKLISSFQKEDYENNHYLKDVRGSRNGETYMPSPDEIQKLLSLMLEQDEENAFLENFLNTYGFPDWDASFLNLVDDDEITLLSVPFIDDEQITGV